MVIQIVMFMDLSVTIPRLSINFPECPFIFRPCGAHISFFSGHVQNPWAGEHVCRGRASATPGGWRQAIYGSAGASVHVQTAPRPWRCWADSDTFISDCSVRCVTVPIALVVRPRGNWKAREWYVFIALLRFARFLQQLVKSVWLIKPWFYLCLRFRWKCTEYHQVAPKWEGQWRWPADLGSTLCSDKPIYVPLVCKLVVY